MKILFEDDDIIVCIKDAGISSEGAKSETAVSILSARESSPDIYPVHRLDRETSGIMVFAKNPKAAASLSKQITESKFLKKYLAIIKGSPNEKRGEMRDLLFHDRQKNKTFVVKKARKGVKEASLEYEIVDEKDGLSLADILLHTGRTHQIRVQFASRKMPLYGDGKYGGGSGQLGLFAYHLEFNHPATGERMCFEEKADALTFWKETSQ